MVPHPLDRPVWSALTTRQASYAIGSARALRFAPAYGVFAAAATADAADLAALRGLLGDGGTVTLMEQDEPALPPGLTVGESVVCRQMLCTDIVGAGDAVDVVALSEADAPAMLALARLTVPGPFLERTHRLGAFVGVKQQGRLVAMAGERMQPVSFKEVSGVCTHPDHRGRGYAGALIRAVTARILASGDTPFLHVNETRPAAIALYQSLGFRLRRRLVMTVLVAAPAPGRGPGPGPGRAIST